MAQISGKNDLKKHYQDQTVASGYVDKRFKLPKNLFLHRQQVKITNAELNRIGAQSVLELACGPGRVTKFIASPRRALAVDASEQMLTIAARDVTTGSWQFQLADIFELELGEVFDAVYTFRFIRHFDSAKRAEIYTVIRQHLKAGGSLIFDAPNVVIEGPFRAKHPQLYPIFDELWSRDDLVAELAEAGFGDIQLHPVLKRHSLQRLVSFAAKHGAHDLGAAIIGLIDQLPGGEPLEWVVQCTR